MVGVALAMCGEPNNKHTCLIGVGRAWGLAPAAFILGCLYISGYTSHAVCNYGVIDVGVNKLPQPASLGRLLTKPAEVLPIGLRRGFEGQKRDNFQEQLLGQSEQQMRPCLARNALLS